MPTISATIITKNEASRIETCLQSLIWVDEIIVLDSGSSDNTVEICKRFTSQVYETEWSGFGIQKNRAIEKATGDWILSIDADEVVTPELRLEIQQAISTGNFSGFEIPRLSSYCGQFIQHSGWRPDYVPRLFQSNKGQFSDSPIHERLNINGTIGQLKASLIHHSFENLEQVLNKVNHYSTLGAEQLYRRGKSASLTKAILKGWWAFFRTFILKAGFLDGAKGLMLAISNAEGTYYKYAKLILLHEKDRNGNTQN
ncbi:MAG: glycosyltransferase family 2 protein [Gammaproteobacteria bacterium]|nr:glycosyltransferase family 2 protein [Gammaproteobacteria bacterium]